MLRPLTLFCALFTLSLALEAQDFDRLVFNLGSDDLELRQTALFDLESAIAQATASGGDSALKPRLKAALFQGVESPDSSRTIQLACIRALGKLGSEADAPTLLLMAFADTYDFLVRQNVVKAMSVIPGEAMTEVLVDGLAQATEAEREWYWTAIAYRGDGSANESILKLLKGKKVPLDMQAIHALGEIGDQAASDYLYEVWQKSRDAGLSMALEQAMLQMERLDDKQLEDLVETSEADTNRIAAFGQWLGLNPDAAVKHLGKLMSDAPSDERAILFRKALDFGGADAWALAQAQIDQMSDREKVIFLSAMKEGQQSAYEAEAITLSEDESQAVVLASIEAMGSAGGAPSSSVLIQLLNSGNKDVAEAATAALAHIRDPEIDDQLMAAARNPESATHLQSIEILSVRNSPGTTGMLNNMLYRGLEGDSMRAVLRALEQVGNVDSCNLLVARVLLEEGSSSRRRYQLSLKRLTIRLGLPDLLWESTYKPALTLAVHPEQQANLLVLLDGLSNPAALDYCRKVLDRTDNEVLRQAAEQAIGRWRELNVLPYLAEQVEAAEAAGEDPSDALGAVNRLLAAEYVTGDEVVRSRAAGYQFLDTESHALRKLLIEYVQQQNGWARGNFLRIVEPALSISAFQDDIEMMGR